MFRKVAAFAAMGLLAMTTVSFADQYERIIASGKLRVATDMSSPPFGMMDANMKPTGSQYEIAKLLADDWGLELVIVETTSPNRIPNLQSDKADVVISSLSVTPERAEVVDFSRPYSFIDLIVAAADGSNASNWDEFTGKSISVVRGSVQDSLITPEAEKRGFDMVRYDDPATWSTAAITGQTPIIASSAVEIQKINERGARNAFVEQFVLSTTLLAIGIRKDEPTLKEKLNEWIAENIENGKLSDINVRYHGKSLEGLPEDPMAYL